MNQSYIQHQHIKAFAEKKVNLPSDIVSKYREHIKSLREKLTNYISQDPDYDLVKMFHSGSVAKGTALKIINDLDVVIYIRKSDSLAEGTKLLEWLKERLLEVYPGLKKDQFEIPSGSHCVVINFKSIPTVEVIPVIYNGDKKDFGYLTTKTTGERILTSIPLHLEFIRKRKKNNEIHYAQIVRLLKWWIKNIKLNDDSFKFKSFMAELLCAKLADNGFDLSDYVIALEKIFTYIIQSQLSERVFFTDYYDEKDLIKTTNEIEFFDPVNPENNVAEKYTKENKNKIIEHANIALNSITDAHHATTQERAVDMWKKVFGPTFNINL